LNLDRYKFTFILLKLVLA